MANKKSELALLGGPKAIKSDVGDMFKWPIITKEDEEAVLGVLRRGGMSDTDVTMKFEEDFKSWIGSKYALGFSSGTASLHAAMFGCKVGVGDEVICPSITYWASSLSAYSLGATIVFADVDPVTLCIDPDDIERHITPHTKAIIAVHFCGYPCDMDRIMAIAKKHNIKVIEDVSHAQGGLYKGRKVGTIGDVGAMSLMSGKSFAIGEAGILVTDDLEIYERAVAFGHYERFNDDIQTKELQPYIGLPLGGFKYRMHQLSSAVGRVQVKYYDERIAEIDRAMSYFCDLIDQAPGLKGHRVPKGTDSTMGGWYAPCAFIDPEKLGGLSVSRFVEAVNAEGCDIWAGANSALHLHPIYHTCDVYGHGKPTAIANADHDVRQGKGSLPVSEYINSTIYAIPWFKHYRPEIIEEYASAFRKVAENYGDLLEGDKGNPEQLGGWHLFRHNKKDN